MFYIIYQCFKLFSFLSNSIIRGFTPLREISLDPFLSLNKVATSLCFSLSEF